MVPVSPADYRDHRALALAGLNLWENHGWMIWDRRGGEELLLWLSPYRIVGKHPRTPFAVEDVALSQTVVLRGGFAAEERAGMQDRPFLAVGYDPGDYLPGDALAVRQTDTEAAWSIGARTFTAAPPVWRVQGSHAGVDVDITLEASGPALWLTDPARTVEEIEERWILVCARARGRIAHRGDTIEIDGFASHERHVHCGARYDPVRLLSSRGITFHAVAFEDKQLLVCSRPSLGLAWARLILPDRQVPCAWRSTFRGPQGTLELTGHAFTRAYYLWPQFKFGCTVLYWWLGEATLRWERAGLQYVIHDNRLLYRQHRDD